MGSLPSPDRRPADTIILPKEGDTVLRRAELCPEARPHRAPWFPAAIQALLIAILCLSTTIAAAAEHPWVEILRQDDRGVELLLRRRTTDR